ncbi:hypothetical protein GU335_10040 [Pseudolactococcus raffinolactis]|uniref:hypothetical protein n=1 Tax=Pseudolactococcus raffinolactis TaxID=1366 RepID=UPI0014371063|nr:hypothetical protein [Lactococcus raffinolactis]QIW56879.1 hypothetical protein GU335_10040 [Lactococcus raffinolactis]
MDDKELNYLIQSVPKRIKGMVTLKKSTPKNLRELTINKGLLEKNKKYTFDTVLSDKFYNLIIKDESIYDKLTDKCFEDFFNLDLSEEALDFSRLSLYFLKNKIDEEIVVFFGNNLSNLDILKEKIKNYQNNNFPNIKRESLNVQEKSRLLKDIKIYKKKIRDISKLNKNLDYELMKSNKKIDELISVSKEKDRRIKKILEGQDEKTSQIDDLEKIVNRLKNEIKLLQKEMSLENVFVIGELSQVIIDNYPNYKIVQTGKEIDYGLIQKELKKNYKYIVIIDFQINTRIKKKLVTNYSKINFNIVKNIDDFKLEA